jgi:hypothetical protein
VHRVTTSKRGWTDAHHGVEWLKGFDDQTREKAAGRTRVLLVDGHSSHYSLPFLRYAKGANIKVLAYPPHCTHALQGLDVVCFAAMKEEWKREVKAFEEVHLRPVKCDVFTELFGKAYITAFTPHLVKKAFEATGIVPFNPDVIRPEQMRPSEATSVQGSFPLTLPSPVRRITMAMRTYKPTAIELSPSTHAVHSGDHSPSMASSSFASPKRPLAGIDPADETPSKRARIAYAALASSSASFLVHADPITSAHRLLPPVFEAPATIPAPTFGTPVTRMTREELAVEAVALRDENMLLREHVVSRDEIIEHAHAQLVLQDLYGAKQRASLWAKEHKTKADRVKLKIFENGLGRHLTSDEFIRLFEEQEAAEEAAETAKAQRKASAVVRRAQGNEFEVRW